MMIGNSTYHVSGEDSEPAETPMNVAQVLEHRGEVGVFDDYKCAEKIDVGRLERVVEDLEEDRKDRKLCLDHSKDDSANDDKSKE